MSLLGMRRWACKGVMAVLPWVRRKTKLLFRYALRLLLRRRRREITSGWRTGCWSRICDERIRIHPLLLLFVGCPTATASLQSADQSSLGCRHRLLAAVNAVAKDTNYDECDEIFDRIVDTQQQAHGGNSLGKADEGERLQSRGCRENHGT